MCLVHGIIHAGQQHLRYLQAELCTISIEILEKTTIIRHNCICFVYKTLGFIVESLDLTIYLDKSRLARVLGRTSWIVTKGSL